MKINITTIIFLLFTNFFFTQNIEGQPDTDVETVKSILMRQAEDWNKGDLDSFMEGYWNSEKLQFIGATVVTYGWQKTLENYKKGIQTEQLWEN